MICASIQQGLLVAGAAPAGLVFAVDGGSSETVGRAVVNSPRRVVGAGESSAAVAATVGQGVAQGVVVGVASASRGADIGLFRPGARGLAAVPVATVYQYF